MSYMRTPVYAYDSYKGFECASKCIPHDEMDAIALMRVASIFDDKDDPARLARAIEIIKDNDGNVNSFYFLEGIGIDARNNFFNHVNGNKDE